MNTKSSLRMFAALLALAFFVTACGAGPAATEAATLAPVITESPATEAPPITLTDGLGREVVLASPAQRVVSLAPSNVEILFAIGAGAQTVGRDEFTNYPEEALALPSIGGSFGELNTEAILALEPDLVLAAEINTSEQVQSLEDLGITVFWLANPTTIEEMYDNLRIVAQLTGHEDETETLITSLEERVAAVDAVIAQAQTRPVAFYELDASDPSAPYTAGPGTFIDALITRAGGQNWASSLPDAYPQVSIEALLAANPDIILLGDALFGVTPESVAQRAGWETLSAVINGFVFPFNDDLASRPGPRLVDGLEALARLLHAELFE